MTSEHGNTGRRRAAASFAVSACFHGGILGFVAGLPPHERLPSIYDREIRGSEKKIVWYDLREKLPEVAPTHLASSSKPRARVKSSQTLVSGARDDNRPPQMIFVPEPEAVPTPAPMKPAPLPNVVAVAPVPKPVRLFVPPPAEARPAAPAPVLPDAPGVIAGAEEKSLQLPLAGPKPQPLPFSAPPEVRLQRQAAIVLPDAPATSSAVEIQGGLPIAAPMPRPQPKTFTPPKQPLARPAASGTGVALAEAPAVAEAGAGGATQATMAIVGLHPVNTTLAPMPPAPRQAGFSAGPVERLDGGSAGAPDARIAVPGLLVRGAVKDGRPSLAVNLSPTSRENLLAAAHLAAGSGPPPPPKTLAEESLRGTGAPGARLGGRLVYTVAIQMPNVTSYSGSWIVWFALREAGTGGPAPDVRPPVPLRKVDPKYIRSAVADRAEGKVLLSGAIRADGQVESVTVVSGLDPRLDASAAEALAKWVFEPATRNGSPVMVDAIFEIPFHLAPKTLK